MSPTPRGLEFLASAMPIASESVDRLDQVPARLAFLFDYSPEARAGGCRASGRRCSGDGARAVARALAEELATRRGSIGSAFRAAANQVKAKTGQKAKALFHPDSHRR